jgi:hypothetical protein
VLLVLFVAPELRAQDRFWNPASTSGNWNTTTAIWGTGAAGPYSSTWANGLSASLDAAPGGSTATLTAAISTAQITSYSGNFTIAVGAGGSLTVGEGAIIGNTGAGSTNNLLVNTPILGATIVQFANFGGGTTGIYLNANNTFSTELDVGDDTRVGIGTADPAVGPFQSGTLTGDVSINFTGILSFQSTQTYSGVVSGFTTSLLEVVSPPAGATTLTLTRRQSHLGTVRVMDNSTLALVNNGTTTSGSVVDAARVSLARNATLDVTGHTSSTWTLLNGHTLTTGGTTPTNGGRILGSARIEGTLDLTGEVSTGSGTLRQQGGNLTLAGGANWRTNITNWTGTTPGASFSQLSGVGGAKLDLSAASSANRITLDIRGQSLTGFNSSLATSWAIADFSAGNTSGGIIGFSPDKFQFDTSSFGQNLSGGSFALTTGASSNVLILSFAPVPVPEPAIVLGLSAAGLGLVGLARRMLRGTESRAAPLVVQ